MSKAVSDCRDGPVSQITGVVTGSYSAVVNSEQFVSSDPEDFVTKAKKVQGYVR